MLAQWVYAALWQRCKGEWPVRASIEHLGLGRQTIEVDAAEAEAVVSDLVRRRDELNELVAANARPADLAAPSAEACQHCDSRGACLAFLHAVSADWGWYRRVVAGRVDELVEETGAHDIGITVSASNLPADVDFVRVKGFHRDVTPDIGTWVTVVDAHFTAAANVLQADWETQLWLWPARPPGL